MPSLPVRLALCLVSILVFVAASGAIRSLRGPGDRDELAEKMAYLAQHAPGRSAIMFGDSTALHGLDPRIIDPLVQASIPEFNCINAAVAAMGSFEMDGFIREVLDLPGVNPRWVAVPVGSWSPWMHERYMGTARTQEWHTPGASLSAARAALELRGPDRWKWVQYHLVDGVHRFGNYGQSNRLAKSLTGKAPKLFYNADLMEQGEGYMPIEEQLGLQHLRNAPKLLENLDQYIRQVKRFHPTSSSPIRGGSDLSTVDSESGSMIGASG